MVVLVSYIEHNNGIIGMYAYCCNVWYSTLTCWTVRAVTNIALPSCHTVLFLSIMHEFVLHIYNVHDWVKHVHILYTSVNSLMFAGFYLAFFFSTIFKSQAVVQGWSSRKYLSLSFNLSHQSEECDWLRIWLKSKLRLKYFREI